MPERAPCETGDRISLESNRPWTTRQVYLGERAREREREQQEQEQEQEQEQQHKHEHT